MKKVLVGFQGYIHEIKDPGEEYEIYEGPGAAMLWVDAPDEVALEWTLEYSPKKGHMVWVKRDQPYTDPGMARKVAYGDVGEQLDMLYKDMVSGTNTWVDHIKNVKETLPKPKQQSQENLMVLEELLEFAENEEPGADKPCGISTMEKPAWVRYPGWKGYKKED
jgi:hypothetical protein